MHLESISDGATAHSSFNHMETVLLRTVEPWNLPGNVMSCLRGNLMHWLHALGTLNHFQQFLAAKADNHPQI